MARNRRRYTQAITYWAPTAANAFGEEGFSAPVVINGRWEDKQEKVVIPTGETIISKSIVFAEIGMQLGGYLCMGSHTSLNPTAVEGAYRILAITTTSSLRTNTEVRTAVL